MMEDLCNAIIVQEKLITDRFQGDLEPPQPEFQAINAEWRILYNDE